MKFMGSIYKTFILSLLIVAQVHFAYAQTASILPPAKTTFLDANGNPLTAGTVTSYIPGTTTKKTTWQDAAETIPNANPVVLDAAGRALILGSGSYRQVVKDKLNNVIWDQVTSSSGSGGGGGGTVGDGNAVGTVLQWSGFVAPANYAFAYGQELNRTTYAVLFNTLTSTQSVTCTSGSSTLTNIFDTSQFNTSNTTVEASCIPSGSVIISKTATTVTLNNNASIGVTTSAVFFPFGNGNGLSTFNAPDLRGKVLPGRNNMGGAAGAALSSTYYGSEPNSIGGTGGSQNKVLGQTNLPNINLPVSDPGHSHGYQPGNATVLSNVATTGGGSAMAALTPPGTTSSQTTGIVVGTGGSSTPFAIIQPSVTINYIIKVLPDTSISTSQISQLFPGVPNQLAGTDGNGIWGNITVPLGLTVSSSILNFNIPALTNKVSPNAGNDYVIIYDAAGNTTKKATVGSIAAAATAGVASLGGKTGGIALGAGLSIDGTPTLSATASIGGVAGPISLGGSLSIAGSTLSDNVRTRLSSPVTYYARSDGNNACNGKTNAAGSSGNCAFNTVNYALQTVIPTLDQAGFLVSVLISGAGFPLTWTENIKLPNNIVLSGPVLIAGVTGTTTDVVLHPSSGNNIEIQGDNLVNVQALSIWAPAGGLGIAAILNAQVFVSNVLYTGSGPTIPASYQNYASRGGYLDISGPIVVLGGADYWLGSSHRGEIRIENATVAFGSNIPYTIVAYALGHCEIVVTDGATISGTATGTRYFADGGWIQWSGGTINSIPGNIAGAIAHNGTYFN